MHQKVQLFRILTGDLGPSSLTSAMKALTAGRAEEDHLTHNQSLGVWIPVSTSVQWDPNAADWAAEPTGTPKPETQEVTQVPAGTAGCSPYSNSHCSNAKGAGGSGPVYQELTPGIHPRSTSLSPAEIPPLVQNLPRLPMEHGHHLSQKVLKALSFWPPQKQILQVQFQQPIDHCPPPVI